VTAPIVRKPLLRVLAGERESIPAALADAAGREISSRIPGFAREGALPPIYPTNPVYLDTITFGLKTLMGAMAQSV
jgi:hypothetical protein